MLLVFNKYPISHTYALPFLPLVHSTLNFLMAMMSFDLDPVQYHLIEAEIREILSFKPEQQSISTSASGCSEEERKHKRMISNRESARRSRQRRKRRLEELNDQVNRLRNENRELKNGLTSLTNQCHFVLKENNQLRSECIYLQTKLSGLCKLLVLANIQI